MSFVKPSRKAFPETPETQERLPATLSTSKRVNMKMLLFIRTKSPYNPTKSTCKREGDRIFLLGHVTSTRLLPACVDFSAFEKIKFLRVVFIRSSRHVPSIYPKNVSFPRHVTSRRPLVSGTATPSPPRTANMNALRLTILAATIAYASAQQGTCEVCHLHYYHKVRPRATMMFRIAVMEKRKKRKAAPSCSSDRCPDPLIRRRTFPTPRPGAPMSPFARSTNTRPAAPRIPLRSEYPVTSNPHRLGLKSTHAGGEPY